MQKLPRRTCILLMISLHTVKKWDMICNTYQYTSNSVEEPSHGQVPSDHKDHLWYYVTLQVSSAASALAEVSFLTRREDTHCFVTLYLLDTCSWPHTQLDTCSWPQTQLDACSWSHSQLDACSWSQTQLDACSWPTPDLILTLDPRPTWYLLDACCSWCATPTGGALRRINWTFYGESPRTPNHTPTYYYY